MNLMSCAYRKVTGSMIISENPHPCVVNNRYINSNYLIQHTNTALPAYVVYGEGSCFNKLETHLIVRTMIVIYQPKYIIITFPLTSLLYPLGYSFLLFSRGCKLLLYSNEDHLFLVLYTCTTLKNCDVFYCIFQICSIIVIVFALTLNVSRYYGFIYFVCYIMLYAVTIVLPSILSMYITIFNYYMSKLIIFLKLVFSSQLSSS